MFNITIRLEELMSGAPVVGAELSLRVRFAAYATITRPVEGSPIKLPPRLFIFRETSIDKVISQADGLCRAYIDFRAAYNTASLPANTHLLDPLPVSVTATVHIPWLGLKRTVSFSEREVDQEWVPEQEPVVYHIDGVFNGSIRIEFAAAIVGHVTPTSATLWFNLHGSVMPGYTYVCNVEQDGELVQTLPVNFQRLFDSPEANVDVLTLHNLSPASDYAYTLRRQTAADAPATGLLLAQGSFRTAPADSGSMQFVFGSCHTPSSQRSLTRWEELSRRRDADLMLLIGDQIYGDMTEQAIQRMNNYSPAQWRDFYIDLYHAFWARRSVREVMRRTPTYMILDDHDVVDDYGLVPLPAPRVHGALDAYRIFQQSHNPGGIAGSIHYNFHWGPSAFFVMDGRTQRLPPEIPLLKAPLPLGFPADTPVTEDAVMGKEQLSDFRKWSLSPEVQSADVIFFVAPLPIAFLPVTEVLELIEQFKQEAIDAVSKGGGWLAALGAFTIATAVAVAVGASGGAALAPVLLAGYSGYAVGTVGADELAESKVTAKLAEEGFANLTDLDLADMWTYSRNQDAMVAVLDRLFDLANDVQWQPDGSWRHGPHPRAVFILGGDVHAGTIHAIVSRDLQRHGRNPTMLHVTSSGISRPPTENRIFTKVVAHIRDGLSVSEWDIVQATQIRGKLEPWFVSADVDFESLVDDVFGDQAAFFVLDSDRPPAEQRYAAQFIDMVVERNYGRIEVNRVDPNRRTYSFNISIHGETKRLRHAFQLALDSPLQSQPGIEVILPVIRRDVSTSMPWVYPVSRGPDKIDIFASPGIEGIHNAAWNPNDRWRGWQRVGAESAPPGACVSGISRSPDLLDVFVVGNDGRVLTNALSPGNAWWPNWQPILAGRASPGTPVAAVSRRPDYLDIFVVGDDGRVYTAWWTPSLGAWHGWQLLGDISMPRGGIVTTVARNPDALDIFAVDVDGRIMTNAWSQGKTWWPQWAHVNGGVAAPGSYVGAVSRSRDQLDIFVVGTDGYVYTATWEPSFTDWFHGWWPVGDARVPPGGHVTVVSRSPNMLDIFTVDNDGRIITNAWSPGNAGWANWVHVQGGLASPGVPVSAISRSQDKLDLFVVGLDRGMYNAAWEPNLGWRGWWQLSWPPHFNMPSP